MILKKNKSTLIFFVQKYNAWPLWTFIYAVIYLYASDYILTTKNNK